MTEELRKTADAAIAGTYKRFPVVMERGQGCTLWDTEGRVYTDFIAGIAVCNLGHAHPRIRSAVAAQAEKLFHVSNLYYTVPQTHLAQWLVERSFADRVFFCNSGAEANEAAIKLARKFFHDRGDGGRYRIVAMTQSFHGRTMGALSATGQEKIRKGFDPILQGFDFVPYDDVEALAAAVDTSTCAVMLEPLQGEGGVRPPRPDYLGKVRGICDKTGALMILDEVQTGIGRTGKLFAHEHSGVVPDIMTLAKALANGLPIGAMLTTESIAEAFGPGAHASTFGGSPIVTAAALETLRTIESQHLLGRCVEIGAYFRSVLLDLKERHDIVRDVRGEGLLLGMEIDTAGGPVVAKCLEAGFLINCIQDNVLRFAPPLLISKEQIDALVECLDRIFADRQK